MPLPRCVSPWLFFGFGVDHTHMTRATVGMHEDDLRLRA